MHKCLVGDLSYRNVNWQTWTTSLTLGGGGGGDSYIRGDSGAVSEGMLMDQTIRENMSKNRPKIPGKCRQCKVR